MRWRRFSKFYIDDYLVAAACLCLIGDLIIQHFMFNWGKLWVELGICMGEGLLMILGCLGMTDMANASKSDMINMMKVGGSLDNPDVSHRMLTVRYR